MEELFTLSPRTFIGWHCVLYGLLLGVWKWKKKEKKIYLFSSPRLIFFLRFIERFLNYPVHLLYICYALFLTSQLCCKFLSQKYQYIAFLFLFYPIDSKAFAEYSIE